MELERNYPIVIIDDDPEDCDLLTDIIRGTGVTNNIQIFNNGLEFIKYLEKSDEKPFIIISDINMPIMNGLEMKQKINSDEVLKTKAIPFIFLTTSSSSLDLKKAYSLHIQGFFQKAMRVDEFENIIRAILNYWQLSPRADGP